MRRMLLALPAIALIVFLSACGSGGSGNPARSTTDHPSQTEASDAPRQTDPMYENPPYTDKGTVVVVNGEDITSKLQLEKIGDVLYAEGRSFVESIREAPVLPEVPRSYSFEFTDDDDEIYDWLSEYESDRGLYLDDAFSHLVGQEAIVITWWATEGPVCMMFMDTPEAVKLRYESPELLSMSDAPRYINGEVYIPIEAFLELTGDQLQS